MTSILALDTSQQWSSISISKDGVLLAHNSELVPSGHSQVLMPNLLNVLKEANITFNEIDVIRTIIGPGSFTGLRVCIAAAQGMGMALNKPVTGIDTFTAYASCVRADSNILVVIDSQKQDIYCQLFSKDRKPLKEAIATCPSELAKYAGEEPFVLTGTGSAQASSYLGPQCRLLEITPDQICQNLSLMEMVDGDETHPFYMKEAIVQKTTKAW